MLNQTQCSLVVADLVLALPLTPSDPSAVFAGRTFQWALSPHSQPRVTRDRVAVRLLLGLQGREPGNGRLGQPSRPLSDDRLA